MKTKLIILCVCFLGVIFIISFLSFHKEKMDYITSRNVEALAGGETTTTQCYGNGNVTCPYTSLKVAYYAIPSR